MESGLAEAAILAGKNKFNTTDSAVKVHGKKTIVDVVTRQESAADKENLAPIAKKPETLYEPIVISSDDDADDDEKELLPCLAEANEENMIMIEEYEQEEKMKKEAFQLLDRFFRQHPHLLAEAGPSVEKTYLRKCRVCGWAGRSQKELDQHKIRHIQMDRTSRCRLCHMVFFDSRDLKAHEKSEHQKKHQCVYCEKYFRKAAYLEKHLALHSQLLVGGAVPPEATLRPSPSPARKRGARCRVCRRTYQNRNDLRKHMRLHG